MDQLYISMNVILLVSWHHTKKSNCTGLKLVFSQSPAYLREKFNWTCYIAGDGKYDSEKK